MQKNAENAGITPKRARAIMALLTCKTNAEAAKHVGISERALYLWLKDPAFREALDQAESELVGSAVRRLASLLGKSVDELEVQVANSALSPGDRLRAARAIQDIYPRLKEHSSYGERMRRLEDAIANDN